MSDVYGNEADKLEASRPEHPNEHFETCEDPRCPTCLEDQLRRSEASADREIVRLKAENDRRWDQLAKFIIANAQIGTMLVHAWERLIELGDKASDNVDQAGLTNEQRDIALEAMGVLEAYTMKFAAISVAAQCNTRESHAIQAIARESPYWTQAYEDVRTAVAREMSLREERDAALNQLLEAGRAHGADIRAFAERRDATVREFIGYLSGYVPELNHVEVPVLAGAWESYKLMKANQVREG